MQIKNITKYNEMETVATRIDAVVQQVYAQTKVAPNLGQRQIIFVANDATCRWDAAERACQH